MKKISGKALSLVLSLALVVSSFSVSLASASTKTMDGFVDDTSEDSIYLVNGGSGDTAKSTELNGFIGVKVQTNTREVVDDPKVDAISHVSGDSLVSLSKDDDGDNAWLKLRSKSVEGTEVISVLYKGTWTDDDGNDYTVKARKNFTVYVYDENAPVFGKPLASDWVSGEGPDDFDPLAQTRNAKTPVGLYVAHRNGDTNADADFAPIQLTTNKKGVPSGDVKDSAYYIEVTSGDGDVHLADGSYDYLGNAVNEDQSDGQIAEFDNGSNQLYIVSGKTSSSSDYNSNTYADFSSTNLDTYATKDASTSNVTLTLKKLKDNDGGVSTNSDDKYTFKTKVAKKIDVAQALTNDTGSWIVDGTSYTDAATTAVTNATTHKYEFSIKKSDGKTRLEKVYDPLSSDGKVGNSTRKYLDVTDTELVFPTNTGAASIGDDDDSVNVDKISGTVGELSIAEKAHVSSVDIDGGTVEVSGKVGDITTDDDASGAGSVVIKSGASVGDIDTTDSDEATVNVEGGTTGDIEAKGLITIDSEDEDDPIVTGVITAVDAQIYSDEAKVTIGGLKAKDDDGTLKLEGDNVTIGTVDLDYRDTTLQLGDDDEDDEAFSGTVPAVKNADNATIKTENEDTSATIKGDVKVDTIDLDSDTDVTFTDNLTVGTVEGDGTLAIGAGKLYVTDSASSTTLKFTDATLSVGTTAFKADSDAVEEDDFTPYGYTLSKSEGTNVDTFKIASLNFAGLQITGSTAEIMPGQSVTYTASAYPGGTSIPTGYTVEWDLDGGSSDVFTLTTNGNAATVKVNSLDPNFASENKTTLTATLYDADGYEDEDYEPATFDITATNTPTLQYKSDTTGTVNMKVGGTYQFKITSTDGTIPNFVIAGNGGAKVTSTSVSGHDYFYKVTAQKVGQYGVYVSSSTARTAILNITSNAKIDTTAVTIKLGSTYQFKVTSPVKPTFGLGSSSAVTTSSSVSGTNYFYKVKAAGKVGDKVGVYVDGGLAAVITVG